MTKISTESYKGVRDFYPEDMRFLRNLYDVCTEVSNSFGYVEYGASPLEPSELFYAKTGEEIVSEQTYSFEDRGGRQVTLRPEMTPTLARMIAKKKRELSFPLRWFSFPNLFRYEQPQKGRLREHYQLNVDIFGIKSVEAEIEIISLGTKILKKLGAKDSDFVIYINSRKLFHEVAESLSINKELYELSKLIDKKNKLDQADFKHKLKTLIGDKADIFESLLDANDLESFISLLPENLKESVAIREIEEVMLGLSAISIRNVEFRFDLMRGFDYYTGVVFEFFDTNKENNRSLFGGGRYDELLSIFGEDPIPAVGFGMGDVTVRDFLETHGILPTYKSPIHLSILTLEGVSPDFVHQVANTLREKGINIAIDWTSRKIADKIKSSDKQLIEHIICLGSDEEQTKKIVLKNLQTGKETTLSIEEVARELLN